MNALSHYAETYGPLPPDFGYAVLAAFGIGMVLGLVLLAILIAVAR